MTNVSSFIRTHPLYSKLEYVYPVDTTIYKMNKDSDDFIEIIVANFVCTMILLDLADMSNFT